MKLFPKLAWALASATLIACSSADDAGPLPERPVAEPAVSDSPAVRELLFDGDGRLLPSDRRVAGLTLPRGLDTVRESRREHVYETDVPVAKVLAYFGPRLFTVRIDRAGSGAVYRRARPLEARGGIVHLDVSVLPAGDGRTRVHVHELPPPPSNATGEQAIEARRRGYRALD
jgi:hypothetical protein